MYKNLFFNYVPWKQKQISFKIFQGNITLNFCDINLKNVIWILMGLLWFQA